jgi:pyruvate/2-oxoglutarate dehydrogenase complex dihydrolipoamide dehydrogenase (E3) component
MVTDLTCDKRIYLTHRERGTIEITSKTNILAMGCRERTRPQVRIYGSRPAGVLTAGAVQRYINISGYLPGKSAVILGSGDIGLIMARRVTLEGAKVLGVYELMPYSSGLTRNIVQCLHDYNIPLYLSHTVIDIKGDKRVEQVTVAAVDEKLRPIPGSEKTIECDTLLLSIGLIPENELTRKAGIEIDRRTSGPVVYENMETSAPGIFACGNVCHVHDLVDFVTAESIRAGKAAAENAAGAKPASEKTLELANGFGVVYTVPQKIRLDYVGKSAEVFFRVNRTFKNVQIQVKSGDELIARFNREHMTPGEMERIILPKVLMKKIADSATVWIKEA